MVAAANREKLAKIKANTAITHNGCWLWLGHINEQGLPVYKGRQVHKRAYSYYNNLGPYELGNRKIIQTCGNPKCVNPSHLALAYTTIFNRRTSLRTLRSLCTITENNCWIWGGETRGKGEHKHGICFYEYKQQTIHRVTYAIANKITTLIGNIYLGHTCGNALCCNPEHLKRL